ncbi:Protein of unknown function DUF2505 [Segniliparus rotundus DSM 44985]|uniref:Uncharacterized protein n=1 Tax=Segniliparus rotundus (strain ATCC BAA-972 / CDC 1076 / CIP 108378 / DSM 44985 / JCM 13578) TaxID=640132 RepID=D6Z7M1_SEGRD|nr:DUF2505 domain-containing protein [Segniliparus rotundus]ADG97951.1 Protein of unknown function DUF2505 [Segniliparus rotundus DSM 44985]
MARTLHLPVRYRHPPQRVFEGLSDKQFWDDLMGLWLQLTDRSEVVGFEKTDDFVEVEIKQKFPKEYLPPIAKSIMKVDMHITRKEKFLRPGLADEDENNGSFSASVPGAPGKFNGTLTMRESGTGLVDGGSGGTLIRRSMNIRVFVPMIGPKLEQLILVNLKELVRGEAEYLCQWLSPRPPAWTESEVDAFFHDGWRPDESDPRAAEQRAAQDAADIIQTW